MKLYTGPSIKVLGVTILSFAAGWLSQGFRDADTSHKEGSFSVQSTESKTVASSNPKALSEEDEKRVLTETPEIGILYLRRFLGSMSAADATQWVRELNNSKLRAYALGALALEHPEAAEEFFVEAAPAELQLILMGWSQSYSGRVLELISNGKIDKLNIELILPGLLSGNVAQTMSAIKSPRSNLSGKFLSGYTELGWNPIQRGRRMN